MGILKHKLPAFISESEEFYKELIIDYRILAMLMMSANTPAAVMLAPAP